MAAINILGFEIDIKDIIKGTVIFAGLKIGNIELLPPITVAIAPSNVALAAKVLLLAFYLGFVFLPLTIVFIVKKVRL